MKYSLKFRNSQWVLFWPLWDHPRGFPSWEEVWEYIGRHAALVNWAEVMAVPSTLMMNAPQLPADFPYVEEACQ